MKVKHRNGISYTNISSWRNYNYCIINYLFCDGMIQVNKKTLREIIFYHNEQLLLCCLPSYRWLNVVMLWVTTMALPHCRVTERGTSNPWTHHGHAWQNSSVTLAKNIQVLSGHRPRVSYTKASVKMGRVSRHCLQGALHGQVPLLTPVVVH
jgi:hypothetical protein